MAIWDRLLQIFSNNKQPCHKDKNHSSNISSITELICMRMYNHYHVINCVRIKNHWRFFE